MLPVEPLDTPTILLGDAFAAKTVDGAIVSMYNIIVMERKIDMIFFIIFAPVFKNPKPKRATQKNTAQLSPNKASIAIILRIEVSTCVSTKNTFSKKQNILLF